MSEFDVYSRDDLIAEIESLRLKFKRDAREAIDKACVEVIAEINELRQQYIADTLPDAQRDVGALLEKYSRWVSDNKYFKDLYFERVGVSSAYNRLKEFVDSKELEDSALLNTSHSVDDIKSNPFTEVVNWFKGGS